MLMLIAFFRAAMHQWSFENRNVRDEHDSDSQFKYLGGTSVSTPFSHSQLILSSITPHISLRANSSCSRNYSLFQISGGYGFLSC
ncbi:hypothetical protein L2E82_05897 [Cichorium intybus]|uniref:Uncharacterized protein n=1 Tax=Cichorium intybus TaxID=13427 RepID=A0ACB9H9A6_CICIN|nr:hypothetical protein L2E82_05897 [Cichorium intybus]